MGTNQMPSALIKMKVSGKKNSPQGIGEIFEDKCEKRDRVYYVLTLEV